ncbi:hypothetical protein K3495_g13800 [Podosphaera aphanis]|nr:hypothetical protein K3495_g13800 [Podosphaera aphanis]
MLKNISFSILAFCYLSLILAGPPSSEDGHLIKADSVVYCGYTKYSGADALRAASRAKQLLGNRETLEERYLLTNRHYYPRRTYLFTSIRNFKPGPNYIYPLVRRKTFPEDDGEGDMIVFNNKFKVIAALMDVGNSYIECSFKHRSKSPHVQGAKNVRKAKHVEG